MAPTPSGDTMVEHLDSCMIDKVPMPIAWSANAQSASINFFLRRNSLFVFPEKVSIQKDNKIKQISYTVLSVQIARGYSRGYKKRATSGKLYLTLNEGKT